MIKSISRILALPLVVFFLSSCSLTDLLDPLDFNTNKPDDGGSTPGIIAEPDNEQPVINIVDGSSRAEENDEFNDEVSPKDNIVLTVSSLIPGNSLPNNDKTSQPVQMEIKLFFADEALIEEGKTRIYGFVTPVTRKVPATSGILKVALNELIKGPLPEEKNLSPVVPASAEVNKVTIEDRVAVIDFNKALITDHSGGTLGGAITMQALVFTAAQFDSVDGVLVTIDGQPWDDGHFIWDTPIYSQDLLSSFQNN